MNKLIYITEKVVEAAIVLQACLIVAKAFGFLSISWLAVFLPVIVVVSYLAGLAFAANFIVKGN